MPSVGGQGTERRISLLQSCPEDIWRTMQRRALALWTPAVIVFQNSWRTRIVEFGESFARVMQVGVGKAFRSKLVTCFRGVFVCVTGYVCPACLQLGKSALHQPVPAIHRDIFAVAVVCQIASRSSGWERTCNYQLEKQGKP